MSGHENLPSLPAEERAQIEEFWRFYERRWQAIADQTVAHASRSPVWATVFAATSPEELARRQVESIGAQARAIVDGQWEPYFEFLRGLSEQYADEGVSYADWLDLFRAHRSSVLTHLMAALGEETMGDTRRVHAITAGWA
jgi:hypothetical protein